MYSSRRVLCAVFFTAVLVVVCRFVWNPLPNGYQFVKDRRDGWITDRDDWVICGGRSNPEGSIKSYFVDRQFVIGMTDRDVLFIVDTSTRRMVAVDLNGAIVRISD